MAKKKKKRSYWDPSDYSTLTGSLRFIYSTWEFYPLPVIRLFWECFRGMSGIYSQAVFLFQPICRSKFPWRPLVGTWCLRQEYRASFGGCLPRFPKLPALDQPKNSLCSSEMPKQQVHRQRKSPASSSVLCLPSCHGNLPRFPTAGPLSVGTGAASRGRLGTHTTPCLLCFPLFLPSNQVQPSSLHITSSHQINQFKPMAESCRCSDHPSLLASDPQFRLIQDAAPPQPRLCMESCCLVQALPGMLSRWSVLPSKGMPGNPF